MSTNSILCRIMIAHSAVMTFVGGFPLVALAKEGVCSGGNPINYAMFINSKPQDAALCAMDVQNGRIVVRGPTGANPAMNCPDLFAWKLFAESIKASFWTEWASDQQTWPATPLPMCGAGTTTACCTPGAVDNPGYSVASNPSQFCPYLPGAHIAPGGPVALRVGHLPSKAHVVSFEAAETAKSQAIVAEAGGEPGRDIRQSMAEIVFRNKPMFDYVFTKNLYNIDGIRAVSARMNGYIAKRDTAYWPKTTNKDLLQIDFPADSVMIKSNWLSEAQARKLGIVDNPDRPHVKMTILTNVNDNNAPIFKPGLYWLVAMHVSSKDIPNWVWATYEHVDNPGRCDFIGCNDSFGYSSPDAVAADQATNFTNPKVACDGLPLPSYIFDTGKTYDGGLIQPALAAMLRGLEIGTGASASSGARDGATVMPRASDKAWLSYRLKGTQTQFTSGTGQPTRLGNSVTEGGFVNSSSCITCHARASFGADGTPKLGVFLTQTAQSGYGESAMGTPDPQWFTVSAQPPVFSSMQFDFVWGIFAANPLCTDVSKCKPPSVAAIEQTARPGATPPGSIETRAPLSIRDRIRAGRFD